VRHHPLCEKALERFGDRDPAEVLQGTGPEAGVKQVEDRMLNPADILRHRQPFLGLGPVERPVGRLAGEADEIPA